ncbi:MAG TPA: type II 3-dehydroquinate dehydratase [Longimicrobiaceae bacterium]
MSVLGLDIGGSWLRGAVLEPGGVAGRRVRRATPDNGDALALALAEIRDELGAEGPVGVAAAPELASDGTVRRWPSRPEHVGADLLGALRRNGEHLLILDDVSAAAVAEHLAATDGDCLPSSTALISVGTGIGGGAVLHDRLWSGAEGRAMDLGHLPVPFAAGTPCVCGRLGCAQAVTSGRILEHDAAELGATAGELLDQARAGVPLAMAVVERLALPVAELALIVERTLDPDRLVLGGGIGGSAAFAAAVGQGMQALGVRAELRTTAWGTWAGALGAAVEAARASGESVRHLYDGAGETGLRIALVQGPNLNLLGDREPEHYGRLRPEEIEARLQRLAGELGCRLYAVQANGEETLIEWLQLRRARLDGIILNPAGLTAHGYALRDTLTAARVPFFEVHLSNVHAREPLHRESCFADVAVGRISGMGALGYELALRGMVRLLSERGSH